MSSLTPATRADEATEAATHEGYINGLLTLIPTSGALYVAMQNPNFVKRTNWQSRTAMVIMPALFMFGFASENKLNHKMQEIAFESRHTNETVNWAEHELERAKLQHRLTTKGSDELDATSHLTMLYQQSVANSGVCVVPGDELGLHHRAANYASDNPLKTLAAFAVPTVATIFWGRTGKEHLQMSMKILHTRVFGQFATLSLLMGVMGFKEYMNANGRFITQAEADFRVAEMHRVREKLQARLQKENDLQEAARREIAQAHEEDLMNAKKQQQE